MDVCFEEESVECKVNEEALSVKVVIEVDLNLLRPISTPLEPNNYMMLDSGAMVTLVKHKEMLHNVRTSRPDSI